MCQCFLLLTFSVVRVVHVYSGSKRHIIDLSYSALSIRKAPVFGVTTRYLLAPNSLSHGLVSHAYTSTKYPAPDVIAGRRRSVVAAVAVGTLAFSPHEHNPSSAKVNVEPQAN